MHRENRRHVGINLAVLATFLVVTVVFDSLLPDAIFWPVLFLVAVLYGLSLGILYSKTNRR